MNKSVLAAALSLALVACSSSNDNGNSKFTLAVIGDVPYGTTPTDATQSQAHAGFLAAINADADASMVLHVGDIHSGKQYCTEAYDTQVANDWKAVKKPFIYTPGDNEWSDCHKSGEGGGTYNATAGRIDYSVDASGKLNSYAGGDPLANLDLVRRIFFANPAKDYNGLMDVHTQSREFDTAHPTDSAFVENVWFQKSNVMFGTFNMPGGSNNDTDVWYGAPTMSPAQSAEVANRSEAVKRWLDTVFKRAIADGNTAIVLVLQADMWDLDGKTPAHIAQYKQYIDVIAARSKEFGKPVLLFNGDSHIYRSDNPLVAGAGCLIEPTPGAVAAACTDDAYANQPGGYSVANFHRVTVHGSTLPLEWLKLTVDPGYDNNAAPTATSFGPFSWQRMRPS